MDFKVEGKVVAVPPLVSGSSSRGDWHRQIVVIEVKDGDYNVKLALEDSKNYEKFGQLRIGDEIVAQFSINSREYNGKYFTTLRCFKWEVLNQDSTQEYPDDDAPF